PERSRLWQTPADHCRSTPWPAHHATATYEPPPQATRRATVSRHRRALRHRSRGGRSTRERRTSRDDGERGVIALARPDADALLPGQEDAARAARAGDHRLHHQSPAARPAGVVDLLRGRLEGSGAAALPLRLIA